MRRAKPPECHCSYSTNPVRPPFIPASPMGRVIGHAHCTTCTLNYVKLPWQKDDSSTQTGSQSTPQSSATPANGSTSEQGRQDTQRYPKGYTPPKGRPTPKRTEQEIARGVVRDPNNLSSAQLHQRRKQLKASMSKEEWKAYKQEERAKSRERNRLVQQRMAEGDERYLMPRDKGPEKALVRDWVDSRRLASEFAMPAALFMVLIMFVGTFAPRVANFATGAAMVFILAFVVEGIYMGRRCNNLVRTKFPGSTEPGFGLGFYAFGRASQPRSWRTPKPRVQRGAKVS